MDIKVIYHMAAALKIKGIEPKRVYLGIDEYDEIAEFMRGTSGMFPRAEYEGVSREEFAGMEIIQVCRPNFLKVEGDPYEPK